MQVFFIKKWGSWKTKSYTTDAPKRASGQTGHFEALEAHRDPDNGDAPQASQNDIAQGHLHSGEQQPENIHQQVRSPRRRRLPPCRRGKRQRGEFEALKAHRDAHNGDAPQAARQHPTQSADESAEEKPEDVADRFHRNTSLVTVSEGDWFYLKRKL